MNVSLSAHPLRSFSDLYGKGTASNIESALAQQQMAQAGKLYPSGRVTE
jgi:hypothetical protein